MKAHHGIASVCAVFVGNKPLIALQVLAGWVKI